MRHKADFDYLPYFLIGPTLPKREIGVDISYEYSTLGCIKKIWEVDPLECPKCARSRGFKPRGDEDHQFHNRGDGDPADP